MPEGDTIHKLAALLGPLLLDALLHRVTTQGIDHTALAGQRVTAVRAIGKHLVIVTGDGTEIRTHLGMNGRWRRYPPGAPPPGSPGQASLVLTTEADVLVCSHAREVEITNRRDPRRGVAVGRLGPDVVAVDFDPIAAAVRARDHADRAIADVLLDQRVTAGIGNIYQCESLFLERVHPNTRVAHLDDARLAAIYRRAHDLLRGNLGLAPRVTRTEVVPRGRFRSHAATWEEPSRFWVYRRAGRPCLRCQARIGSALRGDNLRRWYWCPICQPQAQGATPAG